MLIVARARCSKSNCVTGDAIGLFALYSLCTVRALLQAILQTEDMLKVYEARLTEEETVYLDLDKVEAYRCGLKVTGSCIQSSQCPGLWEIMQGCSVPNPEALVNFCEFEGLLDFIGRTWLMAVVISRTLFSRGC